MEAKKHHYRNVFKSDHLGSADLEDLIENGVPLIFTITHVKKSMLISFILKNRLNQWLLMQRMVKS